MNEGAAQKVGEGVAVIVLRESIEGAEWHGFRDSLSFSRPPLRGSVLYGYGETPEQAVGAVVFNAIEAAYQKGKRK